MSRFGRQTRIYDSITGTPFSGWVSIFGNNYYFDWRDSCAMAIGETSAPSKETGMYDTFYFDEQGARSTASISLPAND